MPISTGKIYLGSTLVASGETAGWQRPADWLAVPDMSTTEGVAGLFAVWPNDSNFVAFTVAGAYDVDWGDGTSGSFASGATAEHVYDYSTISSSTDSTRGYRQVIIEITPQSGASLTSIVLNVKHSTAGLVSGASTGWLDVEVNAPSATSLNLFYGINVVHRILEQATIHAWGGTNFGYMFNNCSLLQSVVLYNTGSVTDCNRMFVGCYALKSAPFFDTSSVTNFGIMFQSCTSMQSVPLYDTSSATSLFAMFDACFSLQTIPLFVTNSVTNFSFLIRGCRAINKIPALNMAASTTFFDIALLAPSLAKVEATGIAINVSFANCSLSAAALDEIYTNLADLTGLTGQTITVTGNYGTAGDDTTIATNKNWTVTG
jgi:hypothetical protein